MADFTSDFWSIFIATLTLLGVVGCGVFLWLQSKAKIVVHAEVGGKSTTGHSWDEDLTELNTPMPRWWMGMFYLTIVFGMAYLYLYPGLGSFAGKYNWKSTGEYEQELKQADADYGPLFDKFMKQDLKVVAADPTARAIGERLFLTYCSQCHGSDARGNKGFPNLTDNDWLFGGTPEVIKTTIMEGRFAQMPPMAAALGSDKDVENMAHYVLSLSGSTHDPIKAAGAKDKFAACAACHGPEARGNPAIGSPNLTDKIWLFGGSVDTIMETIRQGRTGKMPSFKEFLGEAKVHILAAYVWSLSNNPATTAQK